jgi:spore maturation protein SpmB
VKNLHTNYHNSKNRFIATVWSAIPSALATVWWMLRITVTVSFAVKILQYFGVVAWMSNLLSPIFQLMGLPGEAALVFISAYFVNIYSAIAVIVTLNLSYRAITILAVMCLCAHNMFIETAIQKKTGSSAIRIVLLRTISAFILAFVLNHVFPENTTMAAATADVSKNVGLLAVLQIWSISMLQLAVKMFILIILLNILQRLLNEYGIIKWVSTIFSPVLKVFGLPKKTSFLWFVANILGLAYGGAVMIEESKQKRISREEADLLNHHIAISHSNLDDVILLASVGASVFWMLISRWIMAAIVVWLRKLELEMKNSITKKMPSL